MCRFASRLKKATQSIRRRRTNPRPGKTGQDWTSQADTRQGKENRFGVSDPVPSEIVKAQELVRVLEADGWYATGQSGSHRHFRHELKPGLLVVPIHAGKEIGKGLLHSILKKAGLK